MYTFKFMPHILLEPSYNCSDHTPEEWSTLYGTKQYVYGIWSLLFGSTCMLLYIPSLVVFTRERAHTCLKIMQFHVIIDLHGIFATSILFGILILKGSVYCSDPILNTIASTIAYGIWCMSSIVSFLLITNRICEMLNRAHLLQARTMIIGWRSSAALMVAFLYGIGLPLFTRPYSVNSSRVCFFRNPFIPGHEPHEYASITHDIHNGTAVIVIPLLYLVYCMIVCNLSAARSTEVSQKSNSLTARVFTQASIVIFIYVTGGIIFIIMDIFPMPQVIITFGMIGYQCLHCLPSIIYLVMNRQVRNCAWSLLGRKNTTTQVNISSTSSSKAKPK